MLQAKLKRYKDVTPCKDFTEFSMEVLPMLHRVGVFVSSDVVLLTKVGSWRKLLPLPLASWTCAVVGVAPVPNLLFGEREYARRSIDVARRGTMLILALLALLARSICHFTL